MDFDSDDDDDSILEETALLRRPKRTTRTEKAAERKKALQKSLLDSALKSADRSAEQSHRLSRMQSENSEGMIEDDELKRRIAEAAESARKKPDFTATQIANGLGDHIDDGVHDKVVKKRIVEAFDTEGTVNYGLRPTIIFDPKRDETLRFFDDSKQAIKEVQSILSKNATAGNTIAKQLTNSTDPKGLLFNLLLEGCMSEIFEEDKETESLSVELAKWLFRVACSARADDALSTAATQALAGLIKQGRLSDEALVTFDEAGHLTAWCNLNQWPRELIDGRDDTLSRPGNHNLGGLLNCISLWTASLTVSQQEEIAMDDANMALKILFYVGIDPMVVSSTYSIGLQAATRQLIQVVVHKMEQSLDTGASKSECGRCLSMEILGPLVEEVKELQKSETHGKSQAYMTFPALIRAALVRNEKVPNPPLLSVLLCEMAAQSIAAIAMLDAIDIQRIDPCLPDPTRKAFASARAAVDVMCDWGSNLVLHAPQALAMSECATHAVRSGMSMLNFPYQEDQKKEIAVFLNDMDEHVSTMTRRIRAIGQNDFLRMLDGHWAVFRQYVQEIYGRITHNSSPRGFFTPKKQKTLKSFFNVQESPDSVLGNKLNDSQ